MNKTKSLGLAGLLALVAGTAFAGSNASGMVTVDVRSVSSQIAGNINVDASHVPSSVQLPIGVAAQVCGVDADVLAKRQGDAARCAATSTTVALDQAVQRQLRAPHGARADAKVGIGSGTGQMDKKHTDKGLKKE
jgi:hypothetical protein